MSDRDTVDALLALTPAFVEFDEDRCVSVELRSNNIWHGSARNSKHKKEIVQTLSRLQHLRVLDVRKNKLGSIEGGWTELCHVDLGSNYLGRVPGWLRGNPLVYLNLGVNELVEIPDWFNEFKILNILKLHKNQLRNVDSIFDLKMASLNLYQNKMTSIPVQLFNNDVVEFFSWGFCPTTFLPCEVGRWKKLRWLSIVGCKLTCLPSEVCSLKSLTGLKLTKNKLKELPAEIGNLTKLKELYLYNNDLSELPESTKNLKLTKLNLAGNPISQDCGVGAKWLCQSRADCRWY